MNSVPRTLLFLILLCGCAITLNALSEEGQGKTITVDDDDNDADFESIQDAIDFASEGDTIQVGEGEYTVSVTVNKPLNLVGAGAEKTILKPAAQSSAAVTVTMDEVNITGFGFSDTTATSSGLGLESWHNSIRDSIFSGDGNGVQLAMGSQFNTVTNCQFIGNRYSIYGYQTQNNSIENNYFEGGDGFISDIYLMMAVNNSIRNNDISDAYYGISLNSYSNYNLIEENRIHNNTHGIMMSGSDFNTIKKNNFDDNEEFAIYALSSLDNNVITRDNLIDGEEPHIYSNIHGTEGEPVVIRDISLTDKGAVSLGVIILNNCSYFRIENISTSIASTTGITIEHSSFVELDSCSFSYQRSTGITISDSDNVTVTNCQLSNNLRDIYLINSENCTIKNNSCESTYAVYAWGSHWNEITGNNFTGGTYAMYLYLSHNNNIHANSFDSSSYGVYIYNCMDNVFTANNMTDIDNYGFNFMNVGEFGDGVLNGNVISSDNSVNGQQAEIHHNVHGEEGNPVVVKDKDLRAGSASFMNIAQMLIYNCSYLQIENITTGGSTNGVLLMNSHNISFSSSSMNDHPGAGLSVVDSRDVLVQENNFEGNDVDISVRWSTQVSLEDNTCSGQTGLALVNAHNNSVRNNHFEDCDNGIIFSEAHDNSITGNNCSGNQIGFFFQDSRDNSFYENVCYDTELYGFNFDGAGDDLLGGNHIARNNTVNGKQPLIFNNVNGDPGNPVVIEDIDLGDGQGQVLNIGAVVLQGCSNFRLQNLSISNIYHAIHIENSNSIKILDSTIGPDVSTGIYLSNSRNITVRGCEFNEIISISLDLKEVSDSNFTDIELDGGSYGVSLIDGENNRFDDIRCTGVSNGAYLFGDQGSTLSNISHLGGGTSLIMLIECSDTIIRDCTGSSSWSGIAVSRSNAVSLMNNQLFNHDQGGISLTSSVNISLSDNRFTNCGVGFSGNEAAHWNSHDIDTGNTINDKPIRYYTHETGLTIPDNTSQIILVNCSQMSAKGLEFSDMDTAVILRYSHNNSISWSNFSDNEKDILLSFSHENTLHNNSHQKSTNGVVMEYSWNNTITDSSFGNSSEEAILLHYSERNHIRDNTLMYGSRDLISLTYSDHNTISNNSCLEAGSSGIALRSSSHNLVQNNSCLDSTNYGIQLWYSALSNEIRDNDCRGGGQGGISITMNSAGNLLLRNNCTDNHGTGILVNAANCALVENHVQDNIAKGILLDRTTNARLMGNTILGKGFFLTGTLLEHWNSHDIPQNNSVNGEPIYYFKNSGNVEIPDNATGQLILANCHDTEIRDLDPGSESLTVILAFGHNNTLVNCVFSGNPGHGIYIYQSNNNIIRNNSCLDNGDSGIYLYFSRDNLIKGNILQDNGKYGLLVFNSRDVTVTDNNCSNNGQGGLSISSAQGAVLISGNSFIDNSAAGVSLSVVNDALLEDNLFQGNMMGLTITNLIGVTVRNSEFIDNQYGIRTSINIQGVVVTECSFTDNQDFAIEVTIASWDVDARNNWWGNSSGPRHSSNPGGNGDKVSGNVKFSPWVIQGCSNVYNVQKDMYYYSVQAAVDSADEGDTIRIYSVALIEHVLVYKSLNIIGNGTENTTLLANGGTAIITIKADWVNLSGLCIVGKEGKKAAIQVKGDHASISDLDISDCQTGILVSGARDTRITDVSFAGTIYSISLEGAQEAYIGSCQLAGGLRITGEERVHWDSHHISTSNTVGNKTLFYKANAKDIQLPETVGQVILVNCSGIRVENQSFELGSTGIILAFSHNNEIANNSCVNGLGHGIYLYQSHQNILADNNCSENKGAGIYLEESNYCLVTRNLCENNSRSGIHVAGLFNKVTDNHCGYTAHGIYLSSGSQHNTLANNICLESYHGIYLEEASNNSISGGLYQGNDHGIYLYSSHNTIIQNVECVKSYDVSIFFEYSDNNSILGAVVRENRYHGIQLFRSLDNLLENISCTDNDDYGIFLQDANRTRLLNNLCLRNEYGIIAENSPDLLLENNSCEGNEEEGIYLNNCPNSKLEGNSCHSNEETGIKLVRSAWSQLLGNSCYQNGAGIKLDHSHNTTLTNSWCWNNSGNGISLSFSGNTQIHNASSSLHSVGISVYLSDWVIISNGNFSDNDNGIRLRDGDNILVTKSRCHNNSDDGIRLLGVNHSRVVDSSISGNRNGLYFSTKFQNTTVENCNIQGNSKFGIKVLLGLDSVVNATHNWWGHQSGPDQYPYNTEGLGDHLADGVEFDPWLMMPTDNQVPLAGFHAQNPTETCCSENITLEAWGQDEEPGLLYVWTSSIDGELYNGTNASFQAAGLTPGNHIITLRAMDIYRIWSEPVQTTLTVHQRPVAIIQEPGPESVSLLGNELELNGIGSDDGDVVRYLWTSSIDGELYNGSEAGFTTDTLSAGLHTITLKVQDDVGIWSEEVLVTVLVHQRPTATIVSVSPGVALVSQNILFKATGTDDGNIARYVWLAGEQELYNGSEAEFSFSQLSAGTHSIILRVQDNHGAWSEGVTVNILVHQHPEAAITGITPNATVEGKEVRFTATGTDDGSVARYLWTSSIDGVLYNGSDNSFTATELSTGTHQISLMVQDDQGVWSLEASGSLVVEKEEDSDGSLGLMVPLFVILLLVAIGAAVLAWGKAPEDDKAEDKTRATEPVQLSEKDQGPAMDKEAEKTSGFTPETLQIDTPETKQEGDTLEKEPEQGKEQETEKAPENPEDPTLETQKSEAELPETKETETEKLN